jgi:uncharacterized protein involved in outer membrane biogenesis
LGSDPNFWRKAGLWAAGGVVALAVACVVALKVMVDPERLKEMARAKVKAVTGRELLVEDITLRFLPVPSVRATKVALANPPWAREKNLLQVDAVHANLEVLALLTGKLRVKTLELDGVHAALEESDSGAVSWSFERDAPGPAVPETAETAETAMLHIAEVRIRKASILHLVRSDKAEPWQVEEAHVAAGDGMRNVVIQATLSRHRQPLTIKAQLADLSAIGTPGAVSEGKVEIAWNETRLSLAGRFPLERTLAGLALTGEAKSKSLQDVFVFAGFDRGRTAPFAMKFSARDGDGRIAVTDLAISLGALNVRGDLQVRTKAQDKPTFSARLQADRLDWLKTLVDAGGAVKPPRKDDEVYHADPVAWHAIGLLGALRGTAELRIAAFKMGNGLELRKVQAKASMGNGRLDIDSFAAEMLGGSATGSFRLDAPKKSIQANLQGEKLLLERWFAERGSKVPFKGGPMAINASLSLAGATFRDLAASVTGPFSLRMGRGTWSSARASEAEEMMVNALAPKGASELAFDCVAVKLDFRKGRAEGRRLMGARSDASQLLTGGHVDFRDETLDLRGRVQARKGVNLGLAALAGGVQITGKLAKPSMGMDPAEKPALLARAAAAIASSGATLVGEALLDAASRDDACAAVFK